MLSLCVELRLPYRDSAGAEGLNALSVSSNAPRFRQLSSAQSRSHPSQVSVILCLFGEVETLASPGCGVCGHVFLSRFGPGHTSHCLILSLLTAHTLLWLIRILNYLSDVVPLVIYICNLSSCTSYLVGVLSLKIFSVCFRDVSYLDFDRTPVFTFHPPKILNFPNPPKIRKFFRC